MEDSLPQALLGVKSASVLIWLVLLVALERWRPATPWKPAQGRFSQPRHLAQNLGLWGINALISPLVVLPITVAAAAHAVPWRSEAWSGWWVLPFDIVLLDLWIYGWHRLNHRWSFLWRFHQVHHFDQQLDSTSALRFHFGEVCLSALARAPVIILADIPVHSVILFETLVLLGSLFHHSNLPLPARLDRRLAKVIITPGIHWVHHHNLQRDTDSNYGTLLVIWDGLFGSRNRRPRTPDMPLGIEGRRENRFWVLLTLPFRRRALGN